MIRHFVCARPHLAGADGGLREPSQVLNQCHSKVDGDCPKFTDTERLDALVGPHECLQRLHVESTVCMRHIGPRQPIDARVPSEVVALGDLGEDLVEAPWEVIPDLPDLPVYDVRVVEEPLLGLRDLTLLSNRFDDAPVPSEKDLFVLSDVGEESASLCAFIGGGLGRRQGLGVLAESFDAEDLDSRRSHVHGVYDAHLAFRVGASKPSNLSKVFAGDFGVNDR